MLLPSIVVVAASALACVGQSYVVAVPGQHTATPAVGAICSSARRLQRWKWQNVSLLVTRNAEGELLCLSVGQSGSQVVGRPCHTTASAREDVDQTRWRLNASTKELVVIGGHGWNPSTKTVLDLNGYGYYGPNSPIGVYKATGAANQKWRLDSTTGLLHSLQTADHNDSLCVDLVEVPELINPCLDKSRPFAAMPFCNFSLPLHERVADAVSRLSQQDKLQMFLTNNPPLPALGLPAYVWGNEATSGVASGRNTQTTKFPFPITTAMSFNRSLWAAIGRQIGREARAEMNKGDGFSTFWAPVINIAREPRWGRNIETPGEDPYTVGEYATSFVLGFEHTPEDENHLQASACCKHYVANSMEGTTQNGIHWDRNDFDAQIPMQDLVDSYLPPFQACVEKGAEWLFDGYITSGADMDVFFRHNYTSTPAESAAAIIKAGQDIDCGGFVTQYAPIALQQGLIKQEDIDTRVENLLRVRFRLGHFDEPTAINRIGPDAICSDAAVALARDATTQSIALLKNANGTLPLQPSQTVAVIGPNANLSSLDAGYYGPADPCQVQQWSNLVDAISQHATSTTTMLGIPSVNSNETSGIAAAVALARQADAVVLALGTDTYTAGEGHDATTISLSAAQQLLVSRVAAASKKPVVVAMLTATPLDISQQLDSQAIGAVLHLGQPSVNMLGVGDVLFGLRSPSGRLVQTIYPRAYEDQVSVFDMRMRPGVSMFPRPDCSLHPQSRCPNGTNPGRTYRFYTGRPVLPFGWGLSYSKFKYAVVESPSSAISMQPVRDMVSTTRYARRTFAPPELLRNPLVNYLVNVSNVGTMAADECVLGFIKPPGGGTGGTPVQTLFGFERVSLEPGVSVVVSLYPSLEHFTQVDVGGQRHAVAGKYTAHFGVGGQYAGVDGMAYAEHSFWLTE